VQRAAAQIPGFHNCVILDELPEQAHQTRGANGDEFSPATLLSKQSYLALQTVKNPYIFHFLQMGEVMWERELERGLFDLIFDYHCHTVRLKSQSFSSRWV